MLKILAPLLMFLCACFKGGSGQPGTVVFPLFIDERPRPHNESNERLPVVLLVTPQDDNALRFTHTENVIGFIESPNGERLSCRYFEFRFSNGLATELHIIFLSLDRHVFTTYTVISNVILPSAQESTTEDDAIFADTLTNATAESLLHQDEDRVYRVTRFGIDWVVNIFANHAPIFSENLNQDSENLFFCGRPVLVDPGVFEKLNVVRSDMASGNPFANNGEVFYMRPNVAGSDTSGFDSPDHDDDNEFDNVLSYTNNSDDSSE